VIELDDTKVYYMGSGTDEMRHNGRLIEQSGFWPRDGYVL
jgi:hypothetical protein